MRFHITIRTKTNSNQPMFPCTYRSLQTNTKYYFPISVAWKKICLNRISETRSLNILQFSSSSSTTLWNSVALSLSLSQYCRLKSHPVVPPCLFSRRKTTAGISSARKTLANSIVSKNWEPFFEEQPSCSEHRAKSFVGSTVNYSQSHPLVMLCR